MKNLTYEQQIQSLIKKGLKVDDEQNTISILSNLGYYNFCSYLYQFKDEENQYQFNISFDIVYKTYLFDRKFRNIILYILEIIENSIKTKTAYISSQNMGELGYLNKAYFKDIREFNILKRKTKELISKNENLYFIENDRKKYGGNFPIWVIINIFTIGMLSNFYKNSDTQTQKQIAKEYKTGVNQFKSWLENIVYIRNIVAHYKRIYNLKLQKTPIKCN